MKLVIDTDASTLTTEEDGKKQELALYSDQSFEVISRWWVKVGWNQKYAYTFSWLGRPIIQLPEDMLRIQEVIYSLKPDVIVEAGVAHGGSLIYYAGLCKTMDQGRVIGLDIEIRPHNRQAIETHFLSDYITLIEGSSTHPSTVSQVQALIKPGEKVLVILDSNHTKDHVQAELEAYHPLVSLGSYIVATDGIMFDLGDTPTGDKAWEEDNPAAAARDFAAGNPDFIIETPAWDFNESGLKENITHWPGAWLKRIK